MNTAALNTLIFRLVSISIISLGFMSFSNAAVIGTSDLLATEQHEQHLVEISNVLAREDIRTRLVSYGVSPDEVAERVQNLTPAELSELRNGLDSQIAGGDAVSLIGTVFLVLLVLELVGVTDVFKSF